jgi:hypothetical protein
LVQEQLSGDIKPALRVLAVRRQNSHAEYLAFSEGEYGCQTFQLVSAIVQKQIAGSINGRIKRRNELSLSKHPRLMFLRDIQGEPQCEIEPYLTVPFFTW